MAEYLTNTSELQTVANAIRTKGGTSANLTYPNGFATAIAAIASNCTATAGDIKTGKTAWVGNSKITGNMSGKSAETYNTSTSDRTISGDQYLSGAQTIKAVTTSNISAGNIKNGVTIKVGDANNAGRIANVTGTFASDATISASDVLSGKIGYNGANKVTGNISSKAATTYNASTSDQTISAGVYLSGAQTIRRVTTSNISAGNIKKGVTIQVGDSGSATRIANVTGTCPQCTIMGSGVVPVMFSYNVSWNGWGYASATSSQQAGYTPDVLVTSSNKGFSVPSRMTWTFYPQSSSTSTSTITLEANRSYYFRGTSSSGSHDIAIYNDSSGTTKLTNFYKLVSWVYA